VTAADRVPVAADCAGLWRRTVLIDTDGARDTTTDVRWLQGRTAFVDLRTPVGRGPKDGFAGWLRQAGEVFTWDRFVGLVPQSHPDEGRMHWDGATLIETGVHSVYQEHWVRQPVAADPCWALSLCTDDDDEALLLRVGGLFGWAQRTTGLVEIALGEVVDGGSWVFTDSSLPDRVGAPLEPTLRDGEVFVADSGVRQWTVSNSEGEVDL
jgi:hypothetical protein